MIFRRVTIFSLLSAGIIGAFAIYFHTLIRPSDKAQYLKIMQEIKDLRSSNSLERNPAHQTRENAQKDIWKIKGTERTHFQIHSAHSKLSLKQKKDHISAKEELKQITCLSNACLLRAAKGLYDYPGHNFEASLVECAHELGNIKAEKASFQSMPSDEKKQILVLNDGVNLSASKESHPLSISSQSAICEVALSKAFSFTHEQKIEFFHQVKIQMMDHFCGAKVGMIHFESNPNETLKEITAKGGYAIYKEGSLILQPEMPKAYCHLYRMNHRIDAKEIHFDLMKETILCLHAKGTFDIEEKDPLLLSSNELLWQKGQEMVLLKQDIKISQEKKFTIHADFAKIALKNQEPDFMEVTNNVRLFSPSIQNKDTFALADQILIFPEKQILILTAKAPKRVLFWQEGVTLSAPEIHIQKDPVTNQEFIQGKGDIHFTFSTEEQNIIDQFISKYL